MLVQKLKPYSLIRSYKKGANIFFQGEVPRKGVMVSDGIIRSYTITTSGEERTIAFFVRNDILPISWLMGTTSTSLFYYEALTDVRTLHFSREDFELHVLDEPTVVKSMFKTLSEDHTAAMLRINGLEQSRAEDKVAFTLYYLMFRYGTKEENDLMHTIQMPLKHSLIAGLVGLSRENTTKILVNLQKKSIINYAGTSYMINREKLENHIGEDSFKEVILG